MWAAAGASALGTVMQMRGAKAQAAGQARAAQFNAAVADRNAKAMEIQAAQNLLIHDIEQVTQRRRFAELQASGRVAYSKAGVDLTGTARLVAKRNAEEFDDELAAKRMHAETTSQAIREKGVNARLEGDLQRIYARNYITAGKYQAMGAMFSGVSRTASLLAP